MHRLTRVMIATAATMAVVIVPPVAHGAAGDLYATSNDAGPTTSTILRFNPSVPGFSTYATTGMGASFLNFAPNGDLFATLEDGAGFVTRIDRNGGVSNIATIQGAYGIAREPSGTLVVGDYAGLPTPGLTRVDPATGAKQFLTQALPTGEYLYGVAVAPDGTIYAVQNDEGSLLRRTPSGVVSVFAEQLVKPNDVEVDIDGTLLVTDEAVGDGGTLFRVNPVTGVVAPIAALEAGRATLGLTRGVDGFIYVADLGIQDAIMRIDPKTGVSTEVFDDPALETAVDVEAEPPDCHGQLATIYGTPGDDTIAGGSFADVIAGLGGKDKISGLGAGDVLCGGPGKDTLKGGAGKDRLYGDAGKDLLKGGKGNDKLIGGKGADKLKGGGGNDTCKGGKGKDALTSC